MLDILLKTLERHRETIKRAKRPLLSPSGFNFWLASVAAKAWLPTPMRVRCWKG